MKNELKIAIEAAKNAGSTIMNYYESSYEVRDKSPNNPVTTADLKANDEIQKIIRSNFPDDGWLSEETVDSADRLTKSRVWVVDPIDGTDEFIRGIPEFAISIGLVENETPIIGVLYNPATDELFHAVDGGGTFFNGDRVYCSRRAELESAELMVSRTEQRKGVVGKFTNSVAKLRNIGSVAYKLGRLAAGTADAYLTVEPKNEWDICAGDLIMSEAGGILRNIAREPIRYNQKNPRQPAGLFAGNGEMVEKLIALHLASEIDQ